MFVELFDGLVVNTEKVVCVGYEKAKRQIKVVYDNTNWSDIRIDTEEEAQAVLEKIKEVLK